MILGVDINGNNYEKNETISSITSTGISASLVAADEINIKGISVDDYVKELIKEYDNDRPISDEVIIDLLQDKIKEKREQIKKDQKAKLLRAKKDSIDDIIRSIKKVRFDEGWTVIFWENGEVTKVKCQDGESFDPEKGVAMALIKYLFGNISYYNEIFKSLNLDKEEGKIQIEAKPKKKKKRRSKISLADFFGF